MSPQRGTPYILKREYLLKKGETGIVPDTAPPWGTLAAVDLKAGTLAWEVPLGYMLDPSIYKEAQKAVCRYLRRWARQTRHQAR